MKLKNNSGTGNSGIVSHYPDDGNKTEGARAAREYEDYYSDVPVVDAEERKRKKVSNGAALRIGLVVFGLLISVAVCITAMWLI